MDQLIPIRFSRLYKQWNPGEVAGFDDKTARWLVDNDYGEAVEVKATTDKNGKTTHTVIGPKPLPRPTRAPAPSTTDETPAGGPPAGNAPGGKPGDPK